MEVCPKCNRGKIYLIVGMKNEHKEWICEVCGIVTKQVEEELNQRGEKC